MAAHFALSLLQRKVINHNEIRIRARVNLSLDLNRPLWELIVRSNSESLERSGWIINCSLETVQFYVYNSDDLLRCMDTKPQDACSAWRKNRGTYRGTCMVANFKENMKTWWSKKITEASLTTLRETVYTSVLARL